MTEKGPPELCLFSLGWEDRWRFLGRQEGAFWALWHYESLSLQSEGRKPGRWGSRELLSFERPFSAYRILPGGFRFSGGTGVGRDDCGSTGSSRWMFRSTSGFREASETPKVGTQEKDTVSFFSLVLVERCSGCSAFNLLAFPTPRQILRRIYDTSVLHTEFLTQALLLQQLERAEASGDR